MPDQTVNVTVNFTTTPPSFTFDPPSVTMTSAGKVVLKRKPTNSTWTFAGGSVKNDALHEFTAAVRGNGSELHIDDQFKDTALTTYHYNVTVTNNNQNTTSPDPDIVNDPGT